MWQEGLLEQLRDLGPEIADRVLTGPPPGATLVRAERFGNPDFLRSAIADCGESQFGRLPGDDGAGDELDWRPAAAASRFTRHYAGSLTALALVALAHGVGLDLGSHRCVKVLVAGMPRQHLLDTSGDGIRTCAERPATWPVPGVRMKTLDELRRYVWRQLYAEHLAPLFTRTQEISGASAKLLWSNAAEWVGYLADVAIDQLGEQRAAPLVAESELLLAADSLPGVDGPNPLRGLLDWAPTDAPDFPRGVQTRRHCCITYLLPSRTGLLCGNCPFLPLDDRIALDRERRDPEQGRGGPAELRSIDIGRQKLRLPTRHS